MSQSLQQGLNVTEVTAVDRDLAASSAQLVLPCLRMFLPGAQAVEWTLNTASISS